jgi:hypothetical protein
MYNNMYYTTVCLHHVVIYIYTYNIYICVTIYYMQTDEIPMINTRANERFVVISEFGSRLPFYISSPPPPVHMSSPRQQSARLASQLSTTPPPIYRASLSAVLLYTARCTRSPHNDILYTIYIYIYMLCGAAIMQGLYKSARYF